MKKTRVLIISTALLALGTAFVSLASAEIFQRNVIRDNSSSLSCIGDVICVDTGNAVLLDDGTVVTRTVPSEGRKAIKTLPYTIQEWDNLSNDLKRQLGNN